MIKKSVSMLRKLFFFGITFAMLISFTACDGITLNDYKETAKTTLETYSEAKGEHNYSNYNWAVICNAVVQGKEAIEVATSKPTVDIAVTTAKRAIDQVHSRSVIPLNDELRLEIINLYQSWAISEFGQSYPSKGADYFIYYGQHNGFYIINFPIWSVTSFTTEHIDSLNFSRPGTGEIYAIREDVGGMLKEIYEEEYLTRSELEEINRIHKEIFNIDTDN